MDCHSRAIILSYSKTRLFSSNQLNHGDPSRSNSLFRCQSNNQFTNRFKCQFNSRFKSRFNSRFSNLFNI